MELLLFQAILLPSIRHWLFYQLFTILVVNIANERQNDNNEKLIRVLIEWCVDDVGQMMMTHDGISSKKHLEKVSI